jgi:hypothetical protein
MDDGSVIDTDRATEHWDSAYDHDGRNTICRATGSQWHHQTLFRSRKGRYYIEHVSNMQGTRPRAEWISNQAAAAWLLAQDHDLPPDLAALEDEIIE